MLLNEIKNAKIVYYSGTGNTRKVSLCFDECMKDKGISVQTYSVVEKNIPQVQEEDLLLVVYAVHGFNAPEVVYRWINSLPDVEGKRAAVVSVSGGGDVSPNTASRIGCIRRLEKKGYSVTYEAMLVMPSNWIVATHEALAVKLLDVLPYKVELVVGDILSGMMRRTKPLWIDRLLSWICELERREPKYSGKESSVAETVTAAAGAGTTARWEILKWKAAGRLLEISATCASTAYTDVQEKHLHRA